MEKEKKPAPLVRRRKKEKKKRQQASRVIYMIDINLGPLHE
jgi:hypothetical protein